MPAHCHLRMPKSALIFFLVIFQILHAVVAADSGLQSKCRCIYGDPCWPSQSEFAQLTVQVSQPLLRPTPPARPCYRSANSSECAEAVAGWNDGNWRANQTGGMQSPNFETFTLPNGTIDACYLNTTLEVPCGQGSVSVIGVDARSISDVQAAVRFAAKHALRLAVKNTG